MDKVKVLKSKEEVVKYTNGDHACIVIDCTVGEDEYNSYRAEECVCAKMPNRYSENGYCRVMQDAVMYRDAYNDGKNRIVFHSEVCGIKAQFGASDIIERAHRSNLPLVQMGDILVIIAKIDVGNGKAGAIVQAVEIDRIGNNGEIILGLDDSVEIATRIFDAVDRFKASAAA